MPAALLLAAVLQTSASDLPRATPDQVALLSATLHLSASQALLARRYVVALQPRSAEQDVDVGALDPAGYLRKVADGLRRDVQSVDEAASAAQVFSAALTPEQRALWAEHWLQAQRPPGAAPPPAPVLQSHGEEGEEIDPASAIGMLGYVPPKTITLPTSEVLARLYPHDALLAGMAGRTKLRCATDLDGYLVDCTVVQETPLGAGFGAASLQATAWYRFSAARRHGLPVRAVVTVPLAWVVDVDLPTAAQK